MREDDCPIKSETPCGQFVIVCLFVRSFVVFCCRRNSRERRELEEEVSSPLGATSSIVIIIIVVSTFGISPSRVLPGFSEGNNSIGKLLFSGIGLANLRGFATCETGTTMIVFNY